MAEQLSRVEVLVLPTLSDFPPHLAAAQRIYDIGNTLPINVAGLPALVIPVPARPYPASLQVVGQPHSEELLLEVGARLTAAMA